MGLHFFSSALFFRFSFSSILTLQLPPLLACFFLLLNPMHLDNDNKIDLKQKQTRLRSDLHQLSCRIPPPRLRSWDRHSTLFGRLSRTLQMLPVPLARRPLPVGVMDRYASTGTFGLQDEEVTKPQQGAGLETAVRPQAGLPQRRATPTSTLTPSPSSTLPFRLRQIPTPGEQVAAVSSSPDTTTGVSVEAQRGPPSTREAQVSSTSWLGGWEPTWERPHRRHPLLSRAVAEPLLISSSWTQHFHPLSAYRAYLHWSHAL